MLKSQFGRTGMFLLGVIVAGGIAYGQLTHQHSHEAIVKTSTSGTADVSKAKPAIAELPTAHFRETHKEELRHLDNVEIWSGELRGQPASEQKATAAKILNYYRIRLIPHADWEEANLYPLIDKITLSAKNPYTATMRHEHKIVVRWTEELEAEAANPSPDYNKFARKSDMLTGLVRAHFELEDEVLLPHVDNTMTRAEFEKAVGSH